MSQTPSILRLGARGSLLSRLQSQQVADALEKAHPGLKVDIVIVSTSGDQMPDQPLRDLGGKGLFTKEIELALLENKVDFAVHSFKDVPVTMPLVPREQLITAAVPKREDPRDVLASRAARSLQDLPPNAKIGTGSLRRQAQILAIRPDLKVMPIRGNIDTRLKKMQAGDYDAVVLALAGLKRAALFDAALMTILDPQQILPAAGQGALCLQCRSNDNRTQDILAALNHAESAQCVEIERSVVRQLNGDCHSPIAALAQVTQGQVRLQVTVAGRDGVPPLMNATTTGNQAAEEAVKILETQGVRERLTGP